MTLAATPSVLVIALAANELSTPRATAILNTAHEVLGSDVTLRVEALDPKGFESESVFGRAPSSGYAWISWDSTNANVVHLQCYVPASERWVHRDVVFSPQDPPIETGRTLGFVIASIYVGNDESQPEAPRVSVPAKTSEKRPVPAAERRFVVQGAATLFAPRDATSVGGWLAAQWRATSSLSLGLAGDTRFGALDNAQSNARFTGIGAVGTFRVWPSRGQLWLGPQLFFGAEQLAFRHFSDDDAHPVTESSWTLRSDALIVFNWELTDTALLFLGFGADYRFGEADVFVRGVRRAHIPSWVGLTRLGFGTRF